MSTCMTVSSRYLVRCLDSKAVDSTGLRMVYVFVLGSMAERDVHDHKDEEQYVELQSQDALNAGVMYNQLNPPRHDAVQGGNYEEVALS